MRINHSDAIRLETIARSVYRCERGGMGGFIDADHFEGQPFDAALISLAPLWQNTGFEIIEDFLYKWEHLLRSNAAEEPVDVDAYIDELDNLVSNLK